MQSVHLTQAALVRRFQITSAGVVLTVKVLRCSKRFKKKGKAFFGSFQPWQLESSFHLLPDGTAIWYLNREWKPSTKMRMLSHFLEMVNCNTVAYTASHIFGIKPHKSRVLAENISLPERLELKCYQLKIISWSFAEIICNKTPWSHPQHISRVAVQSRGESVEGFELLHFIITSAVFTSTTQRSRVLPTIHDAKARFPCERETWGWSFSRAKLCVAW